MNSWLIRTPDAAESAQMAKASDEPDKHVSVEKDDYQTAWELIRSWNEPRVRQAQLVALDSSPRRPYVVIAMIRMAAMLLKSTDVPEVFLEQLVQTTYARMDDGILNVTDQVLAAVLADDPNFLSESMAELPDLMAGLESQEVKEIARRRLGVPAQGPPPGWYLDPAGSTNHRWWDGTTWTDHYQPRA